MARWFFVSSITARPSGAYESQILERFIELLRSASSFLDRVLKLSDRVAETLAAVKGAQVKAQATA